VQPVEKLLVELIRKERSFTACDFLLREIQVKTRNSDKIQEIGR